MSGIQEVLADPNISARLAASQAEKPSPALPEALVGVAAISLNRAEAHHLQAAEAGFNPGRNLTGTVDKDRKGT